MRLAADLLPADPAESVRWNAAVMELGALLCTARSPQCASCPIRDSCAWLQAGSPAADYIPKGQAWAGTDRQVRGAILAVLREAEGPLVKELLLTEPVDLGFTGDLPLAAALTRLHRLPAPEEQRVRALAGLLEDGLAEETGTGIRLPS
jgi:A/G-specific adenine glycosylase